MASTPKYRLVSPPPAAPATGPWTRYQAAAPVADDRWWMNAPLADSGSGQDGQWWKDSPLATPEQIAAQGAKGQAAAQQLSLEQQKAMVLASARKRIADGAQDGPWKRYTLVSPLPVQSIPLSSVPGQAVANLPQSAGNFASGLWNAVSHPLQTVDQTGALISGGLGHLYNAAVPQALEMTPGPDMKLASAFADNMGQRYGGWENIKHTAATDPVGLFGDVSMLASGGAAAAARVPVAGSATASRVLGTIGNVTNPVAIAGKGAGLMAKGAGYAASYPVGLLSGAPAEALQQAAKAGAMGGETAQAFRSSMRGHSSLEGLVHDTKSALANMAEARQQNYLRGMAQTAGSTADVSLAPVKARLQQLRESLYVRPAASAEAGGNASAFAPLQKGSPAELKLLDEIERYVNEWDAHPQGRTPIALDALKQKIDTLHPGTTEANAARLSRIVSTARDSVKGLIAEAVPSYSKAMDDYASSMSMSDDIARSLSVGPRAGTDTAISKIAAALTNQRRKGLMGELEQHGLKDALPRVAGNQLSSWIPKGGPAKLAALLTGNAAWWNPTLWPALAGSSPRLMGEAAHAAGRLSRTLDKTDPRMLLVAALLGRATSGGKGW